MDPISLTTNRSLPINSPLSFPFLPGPLVSVASFINSPETRMKALPTTPCLDVFPCIQTLGFCSTRLSPPALVAHHRRPGYSLRIALNKSIPCSISSSAQTVAEPEEVQTVTSEQVMKTVHVKFKLQKECEFGQRFLIVGDDPVLGVWDPAGGVPLTWTEGHLWTAQVNMPVGKLIKYKFILKNVADAITWQPGPDRILETRDTEKVLTVFEDWNNPELQNIVEGEPITDLNMEALTNTPTTVEQGIDNANGAAIHEHYPPASMVAENISQQDVSSKEKEADSMNIVGPKGEEKTLQDNGSAINAGNNLLSSENGTRQATNEEVPVLVPGLSTTPSEVIAEPELSEGDSSILDNAATEAHSEELGVIDEHKLKEDNNASARLQHEMVVADERQQRNEYDDREQPEKVVEAGMQTLMKFLSNFRFQ